MGTMPISNKKMPQDELVISASLQRNLGQSGTDHDKKKQQKTPNKRIHSDRLTRSIFGCRPSILPRSKFTVIPWPAGDARRYSRHEVAFLYVISACCLCCAITRHVPAGILGRHAAVALMTGCEALPTMYRIGWKS